MASGVPALQLLNTLPREEVLLKEATQPPNDIDVTDEDLDAYIRSVPTGGGETSADAEVEEWRRQKLNKSGFSEAEFRNLIEEVDSYQRPAPHLPRREGADGG